jgi:hypothetical protein
MKDRPDREEGGARVRRRFERARIEARLFAEVCEILLSATEHRYDTRTPEPPTRQDRTPAPIHMRR